VTNRWARLLKQQLSPTVYCLPTKKKKLPFSVSVGTKTNEVRRLHFLFAANKRKLPFSVSSSFPIYIYIYTVCCRFKPKMENGRPGNFP
jgi:hypothetical protein